MLSLSFSESTGWISPLRVRVGGVDPGRRCLLVRIWSQGEYRTKIQKLRYGGPGLNLETTIYRGWVFLVRYGVLT